MGMFDDLIPSQSQSNATSAGGMFDDLIPSSQTQQSSPSPSMGDLGMKLARPIIDAMASNPGTIGGNISNQVGLANRYAVEGLTALPNMIGNAANSAVNLALPDKYKLGMPSDTTSQLLTQAGLPQPQGPQQRIVGDVSRAIAGLGTNMGIAGSISDVAPEISASLSQNPFMQARGATGAAGAAGGARELGFGPLGQTISGLGGGYLATRTPFTTEPSSASLSSDLKSDARASYKDAKDIGATFTPEVSADVPSQIEQQWANTGKMNSRMHGDSLSVMDDLKNDAQNGSLSLEDLHTYRQLFGDVVNKNLHANGSLMPDAMKANQAIDTIDGIVDSAAEDPSMLSNGSSDAITAFQKAQGLWRQASQASDIERIMDRADTMEQPATALRTGFRTLLNSKRINNYSPDMQDLIRQAATVSMPVEILRGLGSRLIPAIAGGTGHIGGSVIAQGAASIPRNLATQAQMNRAQAILDNIAQPNQLMQSLPEVAKQLGSIQGMMPDRVYQQ